MVVATPHALCVGGTPQFRGDLVPRRAMTASLGLMLLPGALAALLLSCEQKQCQWRPYDCPCEQGEAFCKLGPGAYYCSDLSREPDCGACQTTCGLGSCVSGACVCEPPPVGACPPPSWWGGAGTWTVCRDLTVDGNCGGCGYQCGLGSCVSGACVCGPPPMKACPPPSQWPGFWWTVCRDVTTDYLNCGDCGIVCTAGQCVAGQCH